MSLKNALGGAVNEAIESDLSLEPEFVFEGVVARNMSYQNAQQLSYGPGQKMVFLMPGQMIDFRNSWIEFQITGSPGTYTGCAMVPDIRSIFSRLTVLFASKTIIDISEFGRLQNACDYLMDPNWANYNGQIYEGTGPLASRQADFLDPNRVYSCSLRNFMGAGTLFDKILPLQKVSSQLEIDIYLAPANQVISGTVVGLTLPTYTINNIQFHYDYISPSDYWNQTYDSKVKMNPPITFSYRTWEELTDTSILPVGASSAQKVLTFKYSSLVGIIALMQTASTTTDFTNDSKMLTFNNNGINLLRLKIAGISYPLDSNAPYSDIFQRFIQFFGIPQDKPVSGALNWTTTSFIAACPLLLHPYVNRNTRGVIDGINSAIATSIIFEVGFSAPLASTQNLYLYAWTEQTITFLSNGGVVWNS